MFLAYILKSLKDDGYYFGHTNDLSKRLIQHNNKKVKSTKNRTPLTIYYFEKFQTKSEAFKREQFFKSLEGRKWLYDQKVFH